MIYNLRQPGVPYRGWTLPQLTYWAQRALRARRWQKADASEAVQAAIGGALSKKGGEGFKRWLKSLRSTKRSKQQQTDGFNAAD